MPPATAGSIGPHHPDSPVLGRGGGTPRGARPDAEATPWANRSPRRTAWQRTACSVPTGDLEGRGAFGHTVSMSQARGKEAPVAKPAPSKDVGVAVKRDGKWYQIVTVRRTGTETKEVPGRRTDNKLVAAEWLAAALLESSL